jgi:drug/metabolite transporter (DMT)-like permease
VTPTRSIAAIDALLLLMAIIWGTNYSIVKHAFREIDAQAFNAVRMVIASAIFVALIAGIRRRLAPGLATAQAGQVFYTPAPLTGRDWAWIAFLGIVGHAMYQFFFIGGLARTSVANSSLMLAATPVVIALVSAALGLDRIGPLHWLGAAISAFGIYLVVGSGMSFGGAALTGDLMMFAAVCCWAIYTLGARAVMVRHSPLAVTGLSMAIGTIVYVPLVGTRLGTVKWTTLSAGTWAALIYSAVFALCVAYTIWYAAVRQIGNARTSVYSNLIPIVAMLTAALTLSEPLGWPKIAGAMAVLVGVALTRVRSAAGVTMT